MAAGGCAPAQAGAEVAAAGRAAEREVGLGVTVRVGWEAAGCREARRRHRQRSGAVQGIRHASCTCL